MVNNNEWFINGDSDALFMANQWLLMVISWFIMVQSIGYSNREWLTYSSSIKLGAFPILRNGSFGHRQGASCEDNPVFLRGLFRPASLLLLFAALLALHPKDRKTTELVAPREDVLLMKWPRYPGHLCKGPFLVMNEHYLTTSQSCHD